MVLAIAILAALLYGVANAFRHRSTSDASVTSALPTCPGAKVGAFFRRVVRHPLWLLGTLAALGAAALHAVALHQGSLALVQPMMVAGAVVSLPLRSRLSGTRMARSELAWAGLLIAALGGFLVLATPTSPTNHSSLHAGPAMLAGLALAAVVVACVWVGVTRRGTSAAWLLGGAAGLLSAASAALVKAVAGGLSQGGDLTRYWPCLALLVVIVSGEAVNLLAFRAAPLRCSLPVICAVGPLASLAIGVGLYQERLAGDAIQVVVELVLLGGVILAAVALARWQRPQVRNDQPAGPREIPAAIGAGVLG